MGKYYKGRGVNNGNVGITLGVLLSELRAIIKQEMRNLYYLGSLKVKDGF